MTIENRNQKQNPNFGENIEQDANAQRDKGGKNANQQGQNVENRQAGKNQQVQKDYNKQRDL